MQNPFDILPECSTADILAEYHNIICTQIIFSRIGVLKPILESRLNESNDVAVHTLFKEKNFTNFTGIHNTYHIKYLRFAISILNSGEIYLLRLNDYCHNVININSADDVLKYIAQHYNYSHFVEK